MAIIVNGNGPWTKNDGDLPGLYARYINAAIATIKVGARSKVATIKEIGTGTAEAGKVYRITKLKEAVGLFGEDNVADIRLLIIGGASEIVISVYAKPAVEAEPAYLDALTALESYEFHQYVGPVTTTQTYATILTTWLAEMKAVTKNFITIVADDEVEGDVSAIKANITQFTDDETVVYVANGVIEADETIIKPQLYAFYIAGLIASQGLADAITFRVVPFKEPSFRYRGIETKDLVKAGALVTNVDGDDVQIVQGLTLGAKPFHKIRTVKAKQAMLDDIDRVTRKSYIGKITNHEDGQIAVINGVKQYLTTLASGSVISPIFDVRLDPDYESTNDELYLLVNVRFLDSIEYIYLTTVVRQSDREV